MNDMQEMEQELREKYPHSTRTMTFRGPPRDPKGEWWLDIEQDDRRVRVQWSPRRGFGVSTAKADEGYGEGPDETFATREEATSRVLALLKPRPGMERLAKFFADALLERMAVSIAYGVFLHARDILLLSGMTEGRWFEDGVMSNLNLPGLVWRREGDKVPMRGFEFFEFYEVNRDVFVQKARALNTIVQSLGG